MKPKFNRLLDQCIETGLKLGISRAHKHCDTPTQETILQQQHEAIMQELYEWFDIEGEL